MIRISKLISKIFYCLSLAIKASKLYTIYRILGRILLPLCAIVNAFCLKNILDAIVSQSNSQTKETQVIINFLIILIFALFVAIISKVTAYAESIHQDMIVQYVQNSIMDKALHSDYSLYDNAEYYDQLSSASNDAYAFASLIWTIFDIASAIITFLSTIIIVSSYNVYYAIAVTLVAIPASIIRYSYTKKLYKLERSQINDNRRKNYLLDISTTKEYASAVRLYGIEGYIVNQYQKLWNSIFQTKKNMIKKKTLQLSLLEFFPTITVLGFSVIMALGVVSNHLTVGDYSLYTSQLQQLTASVLMLINGISVICDNSMRIENVSSFHKIPNRIEDSGKRHLSYVESVHFENVCFTYPLASRCALTNFTLKIVQGEKVAIVGVNGSGKSTLVKLLLRFYEPDSGIIKINGISINEYTLESLRQSISCYFQNEPNFAFTIKENINISHLTKAVTNKKIIDATKKAKFDTIINKAPDNISTYVTKLFDPKGLELSGGEHQRLALSRAFYRECPILILDEPSSSLDPEAENEIFENLKSIGERKIVIFTSHKLSNIAIADKIVVLENGTIVESGTKEMLMAHKGRFCELFRYQQVTTTTY